MAQPKLDGRRLLLSLESNRLTGYGRSGQVVSVPNRVVELVKKFNSKRFIVDGEIVGSTNYIIFDWVELDIAGIKPDMPFLERYERGFWVTENIARHWLKSKRKAVEKLSSSGAEGVVFKKSTAPYEFGVRTKNAVKFKFTKTMDCVVDSLGENKANAELIVYSQEGKIPIGKVSTWGRGRIDIGQVVTVRYLYLTDGLRLYQPRIVAVRNDKKPEECILEVQKID